MCFSVQRCYEPICYNVMTDGENRATFCSVSDGNVEMSAGVPVGTGGTSGNGKQQDSCRFPFIWKPEWPLAWSKCVSEHRNHCFVSTSEHRAAAVHRAVGKMFQRTHEHEVSS